MGTDLVCGAERAAVSDGKRRNDTVRSQGASAGLVGDYRDREPDFGRRRNAWFRQADHRPAAGARPAASAEIAVASKRHRPSVSTGCSPRSGLAIRNENDYYSY